MTGKALLMMTCSGPSTTPYGRRARILSSGTNTSSISTSWLPVPRIPSVSQLSSTVTPSAFTGTAMLSTTLSSPSASSTNIVEKTSPTGT